MQNLLIAGGVAVYVLYILWAHRYNRTESGRLTALYNQLKPTVSALCNVPMSRRGDRFAIELTCVFNSLGSAERDIRIGRWGWADFAINNATTRAQSMMRQYADALPAGANS